MGDIDKIVAAILAAVTDFDPSETGTTLRVATYLKIRGELEKVEMLRRAKATQPDS